MNTLVAGRQLGLLGVLPFFLAALAGLYLIGLYESQALATMGLNGGLLHEAFHDVRHAAGFMCH